MSDQYLKDGLSHDVLTFALNPKEKGKSDFVLPPDGLSHLGEVIISYQRAAIQAEEHKHSLKREIAILAIHGMLHLLGYDHVKVADEKKMRSRETEILRLIEAELA